MMHKPLYLLPLLLFVTLQARVCAQAIRMVAPPEVQQIFEAWQEDNVRNPGLPGWRVQILAGTDRLQVERAKTAFLTQFPDIPADWTHEKPYYKLRAGAFHSRLEARAFIDYIQSSFPGCYPAKDPAIPPREFIQTRF